MALIMQSPTVGVHASTPCEARQWLRHPRKTSHMCMPTALSAMQSGEATANVVRLWNSNHGHARDCPVAPQYRTATRTSRTSMAAEGIEHALPSVESSGPSPPHSSCALPCLQANREQSTTAHECGGRSMCRRSMRASDHTLHPSGKWGQAFRLESASIIWGKKIM